MMALSSLVAASAARGDDDAPAQQSPAQQAPVQQAPAPTTQGVAPATATPEVPKPAVTVLGSRQVQSVLGKEVRSAADEDMGRIVDVVVDSAGQVLAAVIDFGGFLGVGSRKIVVDWRALRFGAIANKSDSISLELTKEQVNKAPEYKEDTPVIVLGAAGSLEPWEFDH
jgi:PRC-barrel domain